MLPWVIFALVIIPLVVIAFVATRRSNAASEHPATEDAAIRARTTDEFAAAEAYQETWRKEHHDELEDKRIP